eukprot:scaffold193505_cov29-Prasinocladus_malaysianus.AAC.1
MGQYDFHHIVNLLGGWPKFAAALLHIHWRLQAAIQSTPHCNSSSFYQNSSSGTLMNSLYIDDHRVSHSWTI